LYSQDELKEGDPSTWQLIAKTSGERSMRQINDDKRVETFSRHDKKKTDRGRIEGERNTERDRHTWRAFKERRRRIKKMENNCKEE
jgi:hypothetical protein